MHRAEATCAQRLVERVSVGLCACVRRAGGLLPCARPWEAYFRGRGVRERVAAAGPFGEGWSAGPFADGVCALSRRRPRVRVWPFSAAPGFASAAGSVAARAPVRVRLGRPAASGLGASPAASPEVAAFRRRDGALAASACPAAFSPCDPAALAASACPPSFSASGPVSATPDFRRRVGLVAVLSAAGAPALPRLGVAAAGAASAGCADAVLVASTAVTAEAVLRRRVGAVGNAAASVADSVLGASPTPAEAAVRRRAGFAVAVSTTGKPCVLAVSGADSAGAALRRRTGLAPALCNSPVISAVAAPGPLAGSATAAGCGSTGFSDVAALRRRTGFVVGTSASAALSAEAVFRRRVGLAAGGSGSRVVSAATMLSGRTRSVAARSGSGKLSAVAGLRRRVGRASAAGADCVAGVSVAGSAGADVRRRGGLAGDGSGSGTWLPTIDGSPTASGTASAAARRLRIGLGRSTAAAAISAGA